jgi:hypothetical protein
LRYIKGTQDGAGRISYTFYFCDRCDVEWRLRRRKTNYEITEENLS